MLNTLQERLRVTPLKSASLVCLFWYPNLFQSTLVHDSIFRILSPISLFHWICDGVRRDSHFSYSDFHKLASDLLWWNALLVITKHTKRGDPICNTITCFQCAVDQTGLLPGISEVKVEICRLSKGMYIVIYGWFRKESDPDDWLLHLLTALPNINQCDQ